MAVRPVTVLADGTEGPVVVDAEVLPGPVVLVAPSSLREAIGWVLQPEGLCHGDVCVPVRDRAAVEHGDRIDLVAVAALLDLPLVVDADEGVVAVGAARSVRRDELFGGRAPTFTLPDLDGELHELEEWGDRKRLLVAFASW